ncbi:DUF6461 domain-containing protein [Sphaerisporangium corydalis]|uniref:DUF6461 domain-containing protein n=1 Tax=Sphaerisporangium corydalis TaxID=1441875 RepID=A0ABV9ED96_9ACTN|nr:DUF6461 domain-containing protein [Sphaerisporangium corydalis]
MGGVTAADYAWFREEPGESLCRSGGCLTFVRDMSPEEAFHRLGVTPEPAGRGVVPDPTDGPGHLISAYPAIGGTVLLEGGGYAGTLAEVTRRLSAGTAMAAVSLGTASGLEFLFAADGQAVTGFRPDEPHERWGRDPDRLLGHMRDLGMPVDGDDDGFDPLGAALALAERATGVRVTRAHLTVRPLTGSAEHLY